MRALALLNPMTYAIEAVRGLILDGWAWGVLIKTVLLLAVFDTVCVVVGSVALRRKLG